MHHSTHITGSTPAHQQGAALLIFFMVLILAGSAFLLTHTPPESGRVQAENRTSEALATAKQALLAYAVSYYSRDEEPGRHGILPCPERASAYNYVDGNSSAQCGNQHTNSIGRLPWRTMKMPPPLDGAGECLWYALSGGFYNSPESPMTNDDTPGMFELYDASGNLLAGNTPEDRVVAVVIAPGLPLAGQNRSSAQNANLPCKQSGDLINNSDYLDSFLGINNAAVNEATVDQVDSFITATGLGNNSNLNDRIITISAAEIFDAIKARPALYDDKIGELGLELGKCLIDYAEVAALAINGPGGGPPGGPPGGGGPALRDCYDVCDADRTLCLQTGASNRDCNQARRTCRRDCRRGGGGATDDDYRLPWPAPVDLESDYREDDQYIGLGDASQGYFGRLPYDISATSDILGIDLDPGTPDTLFTECNLEDVEPPEMFTLWQHWKDHWFYVLGNHFEPQLNNTPNNICNNNNACPQVSGDRYAAILIFSGERINNQLRRTNETEDPNPPLEQSKADLANYLEGNNLDNYKDDNGGGDYGNYGANTHNDRLFCINSAVNSVTECTP